MSDDILKKLESAIITTKQKKAQQPKPQPRRTPSPVDEDKIRERWLKRTKPDDTQPEPQTEEQEKTPERVSTIQLKSFLSELQKQDKALTPIFMGLREAIESDNYRRYQDLILCQLRALAELYGLVGGGKESGGVPQLERRTRIFVRDGQTIRQPWLSQEQQEKLREQFHALLSELQTL